MRLLAILFFCFVFITNNFSQTHPVDQKWWKEAVVYQIYPRSFKDSNGDGIGDLKGIISKLDYIKSLGVDVVWLNPIYSSPNDDNGYDISDYRSIMKEFGTMNDFDELLKGLHDRGIKFVMDVVVNHSSDEHEWFKQSRSSRTNPYRNYYHWWNAEKGTPPFRFSQFDVNHNAWKYDSLTNAYYLHYFSVKQPDLNWENPQVRKEVFDMMNFWAKKGVDGFRLDAFQFACKDTTWPVFPKTDYPRDFIKYHAMVEPIHSYLKEMYDNVLSKYDVMAVAEGAGRNFQDAHDLVDADRRELNLAYAFDPIDSRWSKDYSMLKMKKIFSTWDSVFENKGWLSIFLANHDNARLVSRFGNDDPEYRELSSKMLTTFLLTMRGTPFYYNGDELGMTNIRFNNIEDYKDIAALNGFKYVQSINGDTSKFMAFLKENGRDNSRTPYQWKSAANAGFGEGTPWLKVNPNYTSINVDAEEKDPNSCLNYFRKAIQLRKNNKVLVYGKYNLIDKNNPEVYAYIRELNGKKLLIVLNFTKEKASYKTDIDISKSKILLSNYSNPSHSKQLKPYEAVVYEIK
ncbi:MAG: alpha-glucosidase [Bacteroidota bacterium]|nr:alpha-glucosidase [Bacteroidota bacterium]